MIWLGVLCLLLAVALAGYVAATERQMRVLADALAVRGRDLRRVRLRFPTRAASRGWVARRNPAITVRADSCTRPSAGKRRREQVT